MRKSAVVVAVLALAGLGTVAGFAQADDDDYSKKDVEKRIETVDEKCDDFKKLAAKELNDSIVDGTRIESGINQAVSELEKAIDKLKKKFDRDDKLKKSREEAEEVFRAAKDVDRALEDIKPGSVIWEEWKPIMKIVHELADAYELSKKK